MECLRWHGLMVIDSCLNMEGFRHTMWINEWRCLNWGAIFVAQALADQNTLQHSVGQRRAPDVV